MIKPLLCIDFDDTICHENVYPGEGSLIPGALEAITQLREKFEIAIYSARNNPEIRDQPERMKQMVLMLDKYKIPYDKIILDYKPLAIRFVDDRAIKFDNNWESIVKELMDL
jgi:hypothetical protein